MPALSLSLAFAMFIADAVSSSPGSRPADTGPRIETDSLCPSADAVRAALAELRPADPPPGTVVVIRTDEPMVVVGFGTGNADQRRLAVAPDCATRASTVALVIATWIGELPEEAAASPVLAAVGETTVTKPESTKASPEGHGELGAGLLAAAVGGIVPGIRADFLRIRQASGFGWQASLAVPAPRQVDLDGGSTRWLRATAGLALAVRWQARHLSLTGDVGGVAGWTFAWGQDYPANRSDQSLTWGLVTGMRGGVPWGRLRLWIDVRGFRWLYSQSVQVDSATTAVANKVSLPSWDIQSALGVSYGFR